MLLFCLLLFTAMFILCSVLLHFRQLLCVLFYILFCFVFVYIIYVCYFSRNLYSTILFIFPLLDYHSFCYFFLFMLLLEWAFLLPCQLVVFGLNQINSENRSERTTKQPKKFNDPSNSSTLFAKFISFSVYLFVICNLCVCLCAHLIYANFKLGFHL